MTKKELILAGIDEAGLGPLLGPLVVGRAVFKLDSGKFDNGKIPNFWQVFKQIISKDKKTSDKIIVTDSKKLHKPGKIISLEESVLSVLASIHSFEKGLTVSDFLKFVCEDEEIKRIKKQPWFADLSMSLPREASADLCIHRGHRLAQVFEKTGVKLANLRVQIVTAHLFNGLIDKYDNKALAHWSVVSSLFKEAFADYPETTVVVDKQGGRDFYRGLLEQSLPGYKIKAHFEGRLLTSKQTPGDKNQEERRISDYFVENESSKHKIAFVSQAEEFSLPVALASCAAKYCREILMQVFNEYFQKKFSKIKATKGYYTDGRRFLHDLTKLGYPLEKYRDFLVRKR